MTKDIIGSFKFSETDFIKLYCAMHFKNGCSQIINHYELEKRLYCFYTLPQFRELFQDIYPKKGYLNQEDRYLDLEDALKTAQLFGVLLPMCDAYENSSVVCCDENTAQEIISNANPEMVVKMDNLFHVIFDLDNNTKK